MLSRHPRVLIVVTALALFLPGLTSLPPQDRDEPRFAQSSKQMLETGDFVDIRFGDEARNKKPVGIYWLQAASVGLGEALGLPDARRTIWLYRLPSLAGAIATALLTFWAALAVTSRRNAAMAGLAVAATALLGIEARLATTDAVVAATVAGCMGGLARAFVSRDEPGPLGWGVCLTFWTALALGFLVKGPITPLVPLLAAVTLSILIRETRWISALRPVTGGLLCLALVMPWFVLILWRTHGGFLADSVGHDMLGKVAGAQESHGLPPGSYLAAFWLSGWPLAPFTILALPSIWQGRREDAVRLLLAWLVPCWLLFEAVPTKLFHYVLPLYPALAILTAIGLDRASARGAPPPAARGVFLGLMAMVPVAVLGAVLALRDVLFIVTPLTLGLGLAAVTVSLAMAWLAGRSLAARDPSRAVMFGVAAALPIYCFALGYLFGPSVAAPAAVSPRLVEAARAALGPSCVEPLYATTGDREPSLVFLTGTGLRMTDPLGAARFLDAGPCRVVFVGRSGEAEFLANAGADAPVRLTGRVQGIALNGGKPLDIGVYVRQ